MSRILYCGLVAILIACGSSTTAPTPKTGTPPGTPPGPPPGVATLILRDTTLLVDETAVARAVARDANGTVISNPTIVWGSSTTDVATVSPSGSLEARALGVTVLTATWNGVESRATITVVPQFLDIGVGAEHACGITGRNDVYCWGSAFYGELGPVALFDCSDRIGLGAHCSALPVRSSRLAAVAITAGDMHTCALDAAGTAFCWGANFYGQLGTGTSTSTATPTAVVGGHQFAQIVAGRMHTCGVTTAGDAYCWGWDRAGQLGAGTVSDGRCVFFGTGPCSLTPRLVAGGLKWSRLAAAVSATCGLTTVGDLFCWGLEVGASDGAYCQTAENLSGCTRTPFERVSPKAYRSVSMGDVHRCEQALDGILECWGANYWGAFGNGTVNSSLTPVIAAGGDRYTSFVAHRGGVCGVLGDGRARCWGLGEDGQVGNGSMVNVLSPTDVAGNHRFTALASSGSSASVCGLAATGHAYCWGHGLFGQLGDGTFRRSAEPALVQLIPSASSVAIAMGAGRSHSDTAMTR
jgi:alpha-tubulin suppressor-like RCC1 family protein